MPDVCPFAPVGAVMQVTGVVRKAG